MRFSVKQAPEHDRIPLISHLVLTPSALRIKIICRDLPALCSLMPCFTNAISSPSYGGLHMTSAGSPLFRHQGRVSPFCHLLKYSRAPTVICGSGPLAGSR